MSNEEYPVTVTLTLDTNLYLGRRSKAKQIIRAMQKHADIFEPEWLDVGAEDGSSKLIPFQPNVDLATQSMTRADYPGLLATRAQPVGVSYVFDFWKSRMFDQVSFSIDEKWFREPQNIVLLVSFAKDLARVVEASWGYVMHDKHEQYLDQITHQDGADFVRIGPKRHIRGLFWANIFGPEYVEMWGRRFLERAPCHTVASLTDGGIMIVLSESPLDASKPLYKQAKARLLKYLGPEAFDGRQEPRFRTGGRWRKKRDARPLVETGGVLDDVFREAPPHRQ